MLNGLWFSLEKDSELQSPTMWTDVSTLVIVDIQQRKRTGSGRALVEPNMKRTSVVLIRLPNGLVLNNHLKPVAALHRSNQVVARCTTILLLFHILACTCRDSFFSLTTRQQQWVKATRMAETASIISKNVSTEAPNNKPKEPPTSQSNGMAV